MAYLVGLQLRKLNAWASPSSVVLGAGVWALLLEHSHPRLATDVFYVAGDRVVSDPLCKPFSMGRSAGGQLQGLSYMRKVCLIHAPVLISKGTSMLHSFKR